MDLKELQREDLYDQVGREPMKKSRKGMAFPPVTWRESVKGWGSRDPSAAIGPSLPLVKTFGFQPYLRQSPSTNWCGPSPASQRPSRT